MQKKKIAVIIPNYNGYKYSERCFKALERQTFKDFEVCVVDDKSTDDSFQKLQSYAETSPLDIKIIMSESNLGPGHARKIGIEETDSEWVAFCDIDDWYDYDFLEIQLNNAEQLGCDLVMCDHNYVYGNGKTVKSGATDWCRSISTSTETVLAYAKMSLCRLLIKRELFKNIVIPEIYYGEDAPVTIQLISAANKVFVDCEAHYNYLIREGSASGRVKARAVHDYLEAFRVIQESIGQQYPEECEYIGINIVLYGVTLIMLKTGMTAKQVRNVIFSFCGFYPEWNNNKYIGLLGKKKRLYLWAIRHHMISICKGYAKIHSYLLTIMAK